MEIEKCKNECYINKLNFYFFQNILQTIYFWHQNRNHICLILKIFEGHLVKTTYVLLFINFKFINSKIKEETNGIKFYIIKSKLISLNNAIE